ncbi:hypothetical protein EGW08_008383, partial [Elysia chlorotica]
MPNVEQPTILFLERWNSSDGPKEFSIHDYRTTIADLTDNFLTDLDEVAHSLSSNGDASGSLRSLTMCEEFLREHPDIFFETSQLSQNGETQVEETTSNAFCYWFLRHLLRILSRPDCSAVHPVIIKLVLHILNPTKMNNKFVFRQRALEIIKTLLELIAASDRLLECDSEVSISCFDFNIEMAQHSLKQAAQQSQNVSVCESKMKKVDILLSDSTHCETLQ